jgi:hypothetical protein
MPVLNNIERPVAPMLVVRVETDWYAHETEFRYVLQPGEAISAEHNLPIGQVFFVPREEIRVRDCSEEELTALHKSREEFFREKASHRVKTPVRSRIQPALSTTKPRAERSLIGLPIRALARNHFTPVEVRPADYPGACQKPKTAGLDPNAADPMIDAGFRVLRGCGQCYAHLVVDRRGPTVALYSAATYIPMAARSLEPPTEAPPRCPACGAMLRPR